MRKTKIILFIVILLLATLACNYLVPTEEAQPPLTVIVEPTSSSRPNKVPVSEAEVPRVPLEQAKAALDSGAAIVVDVRSAQAYDESHIAGAISIPLDVIETNPTALELDKDQWIITYCT